MTDAMGIGRDADECVPPFLTALAEFERPSILELGTLRWEVNRPTHHHHWRSPDTADWTMSDVSPGTDVDVVADAHDLKPFADESFDVVIAVSVWEHLQRPWLAANALARVLKPGGIGYVCTHQTFPLHGYPHDYFRFSREALSLIFTDAGLSVVSAGYTYRCHIEPPRAVTRWNRASDVESWLNVSAFIRKD